MRFDVSSVRPKSVSTTRRESIAAALEAVGPKRLAAVTERASAMPASLRLRYIRAAAGLANRREAIKSFCLMCCDYDRAEVMKCTGFACPLFLYRPTFGGDDQ